MIDFNAIPGAFPRAHIGYDIEWARLARWIADCEAQGLNMNPDYQREHVWTQAQQIAYVEYMLRGGEVSRTVIVNAPRWNRDGYEGATLIDGKQRIAAILAFMGDSLPVFGGNYRHDFTGHLRMIAGRLRWDIVCLPSEIQLLDLYLSINTGGTPHSAEEIARVRKMRDELSGGAS
jgi:hypothetical protein